MNANLPVSRSIARFINEPMAISESHWNLFQARFQQLGNTPQAEISSDLLTAIKGESEDDSESSLLYDVKTDADGNETAVIEVSGVLGYDLDFFAKFFFGMYDLKDLQAAISQLRNDPDSPSDVEIHFDTPGGSVIQIEENMIQIAQLRATKQVIATCKTLCASGGYFLASQCDAIHVSPSARIGSIGVIMGMHDQSKLFSASGIKPVVVRTGDNKAPNYIAGEEITESQIAQFQEGVDSIFNSLDALVSLQRPFLDRSLKDGRVLSGRDSVAVNMADRLLL